MSAPGKKIRILWVEDHALLRDALARLFAMSREFALAATVDNTLDAERILRKNHVDLVLLDLSLQHENTLSKIAPWRQRFPHVNIVVLSGAKNPATVQSAIDQGAIGFVSKLDPAIDLFTALRNAAGQTSFISHSVQGLALSTGREHLSKREDEVLREIAAGRAVREIARSLGISPKTVERHKENLKLKLNLASSSSLLREAVRIFSAEAASF